MIPAGREHEATHFYEQLFGLTPIPRPPMQSSGFWYRCGDNEVHLGVDPHPPDPTSRAHIAFLVAEFDALRGRLEAAGCSLKEAETLNGARRFHVRDPFGNRLEVMEDVMEDVIEDLGGRHPAGATT